MYFRTFSAKIALAYRLDLVDKPVEHALQMIRRVRNDFAHSFEDASLTEQRIRERSAGAEIGFAALSTFIDYHLAHAPQH